MIIDRLEKESNFAKQLVLMKVGDVEMPQEPVQLGQSLYKSLSSEQECQQVYAYITQQLLNNMGPLGYIVAPQNFKVNN